MKNRRQAAQFCLRLPVELRDQVKQQAEENERSMNSELLFLLKKGIEKANDQPLPA